MPARQHLHDCVALSSRTSHGMKPDFRVMLVTSGAMHCLHLNSYHQLHAGDSSGHHSCPLKATEGKHTLSVPELQKKLTMLAEHE